MFWGKLDYQFNFLAFIETWLKEHNYDNYNIYGCQSERTYRPTRAGGGVSLYIRDNIEYTLRDDLTCQNNEYETILY